MGILLDTHMLLWWIASAAMLPITFAHTTEVFTLPPIHRDPFDRMLVAQARVENLQLLTSDLMTLR
jgi:PIN domain nuclease of toxin-antitoxin system